ncbi:MAG: 1-deoxy-D-xylulose-5-phosphate reductoisomerase [Gammaproteobacteria bacterium]|nr:1-deoxy-D-xylulose-5-phosphate reductoisomerase [Gammaproteobacteria bacterium]
MKGVTILGSTGSIGVSTLDVLARHPGRFHVVALTANGHVERMAEQCRRWQPAWAVMVDEDAAGRLAAVLRAEGSATEVLAGRDALATVATLPETDYVMAAIVGAAGLMPTLAAAEAGKRVLLANKEALVMSGDLFMGAVRDHGAELLPIDSEHNAVFQCMPPRFAEGLAGRGVRQILLTASGGPFRDRDPATLAEVTPEEACNHPNWDMGRKISVDSATMMNKGLEVIEACWLFHTTPDHVRVVLHPQSIVHSMVSYCDGSVLAQLGNPDMRTPIAYGLAWPERMDSGVEPLALTGVNLTFGEASTERFPCLGLAFDAARAGGTAGAILNAANEAAVAAFLDGRLRFPDIARVVDHVLGRAVAVPATDIATIMAADDEARQLAGEYLMNLGRRN